MNIEFNNKILETIFIIVVSTILAIFGIYYIELAIFLYPVLFVILGARHGLKYAIISLIISSVSIGLLIDIFSGSLIFICFAPLSISLIYTIKNRKRPIEILFISTLTFLVSILILVNIENILGIGIINDIKESFSTILNSQIEMLKELDLSNYQFLQKRKFLEYTVQYALAIIPSTIMISSLVVSYLNYLISSVVLRKLGYAIAYIPRFSHFKLPRNIIIGTVIMFLTAFLLGKIDIIDYNTVFVNLIVLAFFMFFIQGLSVIEYKLIKWKIKRGLRIFIMLIVIMFSSRLGGFITIVGLLDVMFDFRKFRRSA